MISGNLDLYVYNCTVIVTRRIHIVTHKTVIVTRKSLICRFSELYSYTSWKHHYRESCDLYSRFLVEDTGISFNKQQSISQNHSE